MTVYTDANALVSPVKAHRSQKVYGPGVGNQGGTGTFPQGDLRLCGIFIPEAGMYDRIECELTTAGEAGSVLRFCWFQTDEEESIPLVNGAFADYGTALGTGSAGARSVTIAQHLPRGIAWFGVVPQLCPTTPPVLRTYANATGLYPSSGTALASYSNTGGSWQQTGVTGAIAAWTSTNGSPGTVVPRMWVRRA